MGMAMRHEDLPSDEASRQAALDASYASAQRRLRDRHFVAALRRRLDRLEAAPRSPRLTKTQFLKHTSVRE